MYFSTNITQHPGNSCSVAPINIFFSMIYTYDNLFIKFLWYLKLRKNHPSYKIYKIFRTDNCLINKYNQKMVNNKRYLKEKWIKNSLSKKKKWNKLMILNQIKKNN